MEKASSGNETDKEWRLLETGHSDAYYNMAVDEAIMKARKQGRVLPTLRLYGWRPHAVSIGYFQKLFEEVDVERCNSLGIDVVRRITGGGAVFHDREVTYSVVASENDDSIPQNIQESYELICGGIIEGLRSMGIEAGLSPTNDIVVGSDKISGNAQTRRKGVVLQHGTILLDVDSDTMFSILRARDEKTIRGSLCMARDRMTSLRELDPDSCSFTRVSNELIRGFEKILGVHFSKESLTDEEKVKTMTLSQSKYASKEWIERR